MTAHTKDGSLLFPIAYHPFQRNRTCHFRVLYILLKSPVFWCKVPPTLTPPTRDLCLFSCPGPPGHFSANMALRLAFAGVRLSSQRCSSSILRRSLCNQVNQMEVADLSDAYCDILQYVEPVFKDYGGKLIFGGKIATIKCHEDNVLVRQALSEPGHGRVRKHFFES